MFVIKIIGDMHGKPIATTGKFVRVYEPKAFGGRGMLEFVDTLADAKQFAEEEEAIGYSMLEDQGKKTPLLDRYTIEVVTA